MTTTTRLPLVRNVEDAERRWFYGGAEQTWLARAADTSETFLLASTVMVQDKVSIYQRSKYTIDDWIYQATGSSPLVIANTKGAWPTVSTISCFGLAGATAGAIITAIACALNELYISICRLTCI